MIVCELHRELRLLEYVINKTCSEEKKLKIKFTTYMMYSREA